MINIKLDRYSLAIRRWLPYSLVGAAISLVTALVFHVSLAKTVVAIALAMVLIFSGFLLRSFGKGKEEGLANE
jgi:sulfite exporter TauE/SafE